MKSLRKADVTPEEWAVYREWRREYNKRYRQENPEKVRKLEYAARTRYRHRTMETSAGRSKPTVCDACGHDGERRIVWDHDYKTNQFRGWICANCNLALGHVHDSVENLRQLIVYLERKNDNPVASPAALNFSGRKQNAIKRDNQRRRRDRG
jgi:hypothetical protein